MHENVNYEKCIGYEKALKPWTKRTKARSICWTDVTFYFTQNSVTESGNSGAILPFFMFKVMYNILLSWKSHGWSTEVDTPALSVWYFSTVRSCYDHTLMLCNMYCDFFPYRLVLLSHTHNLSCQIKFRPFTRITYISRLPCTASAWGRNVCLSTS